MAQPTPKPPDEVDEAPTGTPSRPEADAPLAEIEPRLSLEEFMTLHTPMMHRSTSVQKASEAALQRWLRTQGKESHGYYTRDEWVAFYDQMLAQA